MRSQLKRIKTYCGKNTAQAEQPINPRFIFGFAVARSPGQDKAAIYKKHRKPRCFDQTKKL